MASAPLSEIATQPGMDVHPPAFFVTLKVWFAWAGESEFSLRYLSVCFSLLTTALLIRFGQFVGTRLTGYWVGFLVAISPFYVAYAQEVRMYAQVTFFATASTWFLWHLLTEMKQTGKNQPSRWWLAGYIISTTLTLYTHYFTIFLLIFQNGWWMLIFLIKMGKRDNFKELFAHWIISQSSILLLFSPQLRLALRQVNDYLNPNLMPPSLGYYLNHTWQAYTLGLTIEPERAANHSLILAIILVFGLGLKLVWQTGLRQTSLILSSWLLIPLTTYYLVLQSRPSYEPRYLILATPALFLLFGVIATPFPTQLRSPWGTVLPTALGLIISLMLSIGLVSYFTNLPFFKDDAAGVATWLSQETTAEDIVLVDVPHPFHYYAERIPAPTAYFFVDIHTTAQTLNGLALGRERLYWVHWTGSDTDPRGVMPFLAHKQAGPPLGEHILRGYQITWYTLTDAPFSLPQSLTPADVNFDHHLHLDGLAYSETVPAGGTVWATLHFTQLGEMTVNYKLSLRLRAPDGRVLAQVDKPVLNDRHFQTAAWPLADPALNQAINVYLLPLNDPTYTGSLILEAVVYNAEDLAAIAAYGPPTTNDDLVSAQIGGVVVH